MNFELKKLSLPAYSNDRVIDTLEIARRKHPMGPNTLDALCSRYNVDNSRREKHGALLDAELLADVYIELMGGKQRGLDFATDEKVATTTQTSSKREAIQRPNQLPSRLTQDASSAHRAFVDELGSETQWHKIWDKK